ncbi:hypothetical protein DFS33DRAFT_1274068 [Desarmillaria ectypa]|nr:hypothetical protein DFS33DRAFT_1274068 [Desarmillaria ectypa]
MSSSSKTGTSHFVGSSDVKPSIRRRPYTEILAPSWATNFSRDVSDGDLLSHKCKLKRTTVALFVKEGTQALWTYYVTKQAFIDQAEEVKQDWIQKILVQKSDEYLSVKARISLRKYGESVTGSNVKNEMHRLKTMPKNRQNLETRDIIDALVRGDEGLEIIRLQCWDLTIR